jgi:hypothetical protein
MPTTPNTSSFERARPHPHRLGRHVAPLALLAMALFPLLPVTSAAAAQAPIGLGTATSFAVLAGSGITNTGATTVTGDIGTFPTPSETGFGSITQSGVNHAGDAVTQGAKNNLVSGYNQAAAATPAISVATELGGRTLTPGVYSSPTLGLTGTLTLDAQGNPQSVFILKAASTLITASGSNVVVINGGSGCNVFWQVGSSATFGTASHLVGTVMAKTSITATTSATFIGRLLAENGAVTLHNNTIVRPNCVTTPTTTTTNGVPPGFIRNLNGTLSPIGGITPGLTPGLGVPTAVPATPVITTTLAFTGSNPWMPVYGVLTVSLGFALVQLARRRTRIT